MAPALKVIQNHISSVADSVELLGDLDAPLAVKGCDHVSFPSHRAQLPVQEGGVK
ncbi:hypothetical protein ACFZB2_41000 [Streptomyces bobili]|uniref:hypothetical protein n=1 Tax=Streptomyces bobili TaxID=67280 RepID=UPI0036E15A44